MIQLNMIMKSRYRQSRYISFAVRFGVLITILAMITIGTGSCIVEKSAFLIIENQMPRDVKILYSETFPDGKQSPRYSMDTVLAGNTTQMTRSIILGGIGALKNVVLQAEDSSGKVIWQKTWTGAEFVKLKDVGWKIVVSPETSDPLIAP